MKKTLPFIGIVLLLALMNAEGVFAQKKVVIKLASLAPENTEWGAALNRMSSAWAAATQGAVELRIYHNGIVGEEGDVLRKLRLNQIQGAVFTSFGLNLITPEIMTLSVPFFIRNDEELRAVLGTIKPELEAKINEKGFYTLAWAKSGWITIFSKSKILIPGDLKRQKIGIHPDSPELTQAFKSMGYQMIPMNTNDALLSLNSGMIDAIYQSPVFVGGMQIFGVAKHMLSLNIAPFMGGIVLNQQAWRAIPAQYKAQLSKISQDIAKEIDDSISRLEADTIKTMIRYGLVINQVSPAQEQEWYADVERVMPSLLGTAFDRDMYRKIEGILKQHRSRP